MRSSREQLQIPTCLERVRWLSKSLAADNHVSVTSDYSGGWRGDLLAYRFGLPTCILQHLGLRIATRQLLDAGNYDLELQSKLAKDLSPLGRAGGEDEAQASSGNQISISRSADSSESEPWTML